MSAVPPRPAAGGGGSSGGPAHGAARCAARHCAARDGALKSAERLLSRRGEMSARRGDFLSSDVSEKSDIAHSAGSFGESLLLSSALAAYCQMDYIVKPLSCALGNMTRLKRLMDCQYYRNIILENNN